jgi:dihydrofolate reductase
MRKIKLYIAISLNGKIARSDGSVDWLENIPNPEKTDHGYQEFYNSIDTTIQGYSTYKQISDWDIDFPYTDKKNYVLTSKENPLPDKNVEFVTKNHIEFIQNLKQQEGGDIWLIGGGNTNTLLLNEKLIDLLHVFIMPVVLPDGIELFENFPLESKFTFIESKAYSSGAVELVYDI